MGRTDRKTPVQHGPYCLATNSPSTDTDTSEDCLFLDVYAPSNATSRSKLPVFIFIQGGGFNVNSNPNYNGTGLVTASGNNIIVVTFNYRVGLYGFLTDGDEISPNNGLFDQRKVMQWVQKYITQFGGVRISSPLRKNYRCRTGSSARCQWLWALWNPASSELLPSDIVS